jgi:hypothetical protein
MRRHEPQQPYHERLLGERQAPVRERLGARVGRQPRARLQTVRGQRDRATEQGRGGAPRLRDVGEEREREHGAGFISNSETQLGIFGNLVYCREGVDDEDPTKEQAKCEDGTGKALVKFVGAVNKCYAKCNGNVFKLAIPDGSCTPGAVTDPTGATQACLDKGRVKAAAAIDKVCVTVPGNPPCYGPGLDTGPEWVMFTENIGINPIAAQVACGSPSGAFLD